MISHRAHHQEWTPSSWQTKPALQQPVYPDPEGVHAALARLASLPPLVTSGEIEALKANLAAATRGEMFLLQGGDCSESFDDCEPYLIADKLKILLQMSLLLAHAGKTRVIRVGRIAGQYAKPRSSEHEIRGELALPSYRGDMINRRGATLEDRTPDPNLMIRAHEHAAMTLNFIRALFNGGFADLHHPEHWRLDVIARFPHAEEYMRMVESIGESIRTVELLAGREVNDPRRFDMFTSHEALLLPYEQALTRRVPRRLGWYNLSTHFPWMGNRTRDIDGAHVEYFRGIANPIAVKLGPSAEPLEVLELAELLNPGDEPGRLTFIHRLGADDVERRLPPLVEILRRRGKVVLWVCDPMHGNTEATSSGLKTRRFDRIMLEIERSIRVHEEVGSRLGGIHIELTGEAVTECIGGASGIGEEDLSRAYRTHVDPRLNYDQALELTVRLVKLVTRKAV